MLNTNRWLAWQGRAVVAHLTGHWAGCRLQGRHRHLLQRLHARSVWQVGLRLGLFRALAAVLQQEQLHIAIQPRPAAPQQRAHAEHLHLHSRREGIQVGSVHKAHAKVWVWAARQRAKTAPCSASHLLPMYLCCPTRTVTAVGACASMLLLLQQTARHEPGAHLPVQPLLWQLLSHSPSSWQ